MPYYPGDFTKPVVGDSRETVIDRARINDAALRDAMVLGGDGNLDWSITATGDAYRPATLTASNGQQRIRWELTWGASPAVNQCQQVIAKYSSDGGSNYFIVGTFTFNFTGENVTSGNVGSLLLARFFSLLNYAYNVGFGLTTHSSAQGAAVHGLGSISTQAADAVNIDGGSIDGTPIGVTAQAEGYFNRATERYASTSLTLNQTFGIDWTYGGTYISMNGSHTINAFSNVPAARIATHMVVVSGNFNNLTWSPSGSVMTWGLSGTTPPSIPGSAIIQLVSFDGGANVAAGVFWRAA